MKFVEDTYGDKAAEAVAALNDGDILVLENVRFDKREKKNDPEIAKKLASYGDIFVLDAFGTAHRAQGSVVGARRATCPPTPASCLQKEVDTLTSMLRRARASVRGHRRRLQGVLQDRCPRSPHRLR